VNSSKYIFLKRKSPFGLEHDSEKQVRRLMPGETHFSRLRAAPA
jgi:hypothetical protein